MSLPNSTDTEPFYAASLVALHALEAREGRARRFGSDADVRWSQFAGGLRVADRIDLLLRDASGQWGAAFSPAAVWSLPGLSTDEPFGPDWSPLSEDRAEALWARPAGDSLDSALAALGLNPPAVVLPPLAPTTRLLLAGPGAILTAARAFAANQALSWTDQVLVVADRPQTRHLAGLVAPLIGASGPTRLVTPTDDVAATLKAAGFSHGAQAVVGPNASPAAQAFARTAGA